MDTKYDLELGLEELVLGISLAGYPEIAKGMLVVNYADINEEEEKGRFYSASHSLLAKDLIKLDFDKPVLLEKSNHYFTTIASFKDQLRFDKYIDNYSVICNLYLYNNMYYEHFIPNPVVHKIRILENKTAYQDTLERYLEFNPLKTKFDQWEIRGDLFQNLYSGKRENLNTRSKRLLLDLGIDDVTAKHLSRDLSEFKYKASVMAISQQENNETTGSGFLFLAGNMNSWIFHISERNELGYLSIRPGSRSIFLEEMNILFQKGG